MRSIGARPALAGWLVALVPFAFYVVWLTQGRSIWLDRSYGGGPDVLIMLIGTGFLLLSVTGVLIGLLAGGIAVVFSAPEVLFRRARIAAAGVAGLLATTFGMRFSLEASRPQVLRLIVIFGVVAAIAYVLLPWIAGRTTVRATTPIVTRPRPFTPYRLAWTVLAAFVGYLVGQIVASHTHLYASGLTLRDVVPVVAAAVALVAAAATWFTLPESD